MIRIRSGSDTISITTANAQADFMRALQAALTWGLD